MSVVGKMTQVGKVLALQIWRPEVGPQHSCRNQASCGLQCQAGCGLWSHGVIFHLPGDLVCPGAAWPLSAQRGSLSTFSPNYIKVFGLWPWTLGGPRWRGCLW